MTDFHAIVAAHSDAVWRTAYRLLNHYDDALDCHQETFLAAWELARNQRVSNWHTLLVRIATRRAIDRLRERFRVARAAAEMQPSTRRLFEMPDARAEALELHEQVRRALATLPEQQAEAFWLRHLEHLSTTEVAQTLQIEDGHVRVLVHRAAAGLRTILGPALGHKPTSESLP